MIATGDRMRLAGQGLERSVVEASSSPQAAGAPLRLLVAGGSLTRVCGVRDHHRVLQQALGTLGVTVETVWWERDATASLRASRGAALAWCGRVRSAATRLRPDFLLWHYVPTTYGYRGVPWLVPIVTRGLARSRVPMVPFLHELIYPWGRRGWKGTVHAVTTRAALVGVLRAASGAVVTTEQRQEWLQRSWWTPRRPVALAPVYSNIQVVDRWCGAPADDGRAASIGVFGFGSEGLLVDVVTTALAILRKRGRPIRLVLIGGPGPTAPAAGRWREGSRRSGGPAPEFTDILEPSALSGALSRLDILLMPEGVGPTSGKGTLAAGLAHGVPIVAFDARTAWRSLVRERAVALAHPTPGRLAERLEELLRDGAARSELGTRAEAFYAAHLEPVVVADRLTAFLRQLRATGNGGDRCASSG
jgi:glycosyltransferase involved in cell wall biosynthesis